MNCSQPTLVSEYKLDVKHRSPEEIQKYKNYLGNILEFGFNINQAAILSWMLVDNIINWDEITLFVSMLVRLNLIVDRNFQSLIHKKK
jgi:hypothetical protein